MKILVVDDDKRIVKTTCDILKIKGHEAIAAYSGEEGVEKVRNDAPDCVLMDIKMTGINGVEAMIRMKEIAPSLPVVLVSAYATDSVMEEAERAGAYAILSKPLNFPLILSFLSILRMEESILVVDDDPIFCTTLESVLTRRGFLVETESDPLKVMAHLENDHKLTVMLDLKLSEPDDLELLNRIRLRYPTMPVVLMTGYRHEMGALIDKAASIGVYTYLYKPFETETLLQLIEEIRIKKFKHILGEGS